MSGLGSVAPFLICLVLDASWYSFDEGREGKSESIVLYWYDIIIPATPWESSRFIRSAYDLATRYLGHNDRVSCTLHLIALSCVTLILTNLLADRKTFTDVVAHSAGQAAARVGLGPAWRTEVLCSGVCLGLI